MKQTKEQPIEQFVRIIGEENFHRFHVEYLLKGRKDAIEQLIKDNKKNSIFYGIIWSQTEDGRYFWCKLDLKLQKEWRE